MSIDSLKALSYDELRLNYKAYLSTLNLSAFTKSTAATDAFYLWRHESKELFWSVVLADDFEEISKKYLAQILKHNSKGNIASQVNAYYSHLKRFKEFVLGKSNNPIQSVTKPRKMTQNQRRIPKPSSEILQQYLLKWDKLENYHLQEDALNKLFRQLCPENKSVEDVLLKCATLNDFYSTNIFSTYSIAKHIVDLKIDERLQKGDVTLVNDIQSISIGGKDRKFYSFATKYCSHHNDEAFPIYDSYVEKVLFYFQKEDAFSDSGFKLQDLKNYTVFKRALIDFREYYGLRKYSLKEIDQYIWQLGKEYFPKKYK